jgi:L-threonylcarbamoyladenylate synthase
VNKDLLIEKAVSCLKNGGVIIFPTATVYGLGAAFSNKAARRRIYRLKKRPSRKPLVLMLASKRHLSRSPLALSLVQKALIDEIWPAPVTFVVKAPAKLARQAGSKNGTLAIRLADHPLTKKIIGKMKTGLLTTSANISSELAARKIEEIPTDLLSNVELVIGAGPTKHRLASTVVDITGAKPQILRPGAFPEKLFFKKAKTVWPGL